MVANVAHRFSCLLMTLTIVGCFGPHIESGAFACDPHDDPPCPSGFYCFDERCVANAADVRSSEPRDLGDDAGPRHDLATRDLAAGGDLEPPPDLTPPADLATGMCGHAGAPCTTIQDCCSHYCRTDGICIGG